MAIGEGVSIESVYNNSKVIWGPSMPNKLIKGIQTRGGTYGRLNTDQMETFPDGMTVIEVRWYTEQDKYICRFRHKLCFSKPHLIHLDNGFFDFFDVEEICDKLDILGQRL